VPDHGQRGRAARPQHVERLERVGPVVGQTRVGDAGRLAVAAPFPGVDGKALRERGALRPPRPGRAADAVQKEEGGRAGDALDVKRAAARQVDPLVQ